jgi:hypothetical protein
VLKKRAGQPVQARGRGQSGCCDPVKHIVVSRDFAIKKRAGQPVQARGRGQPGCCA